jgi:transposase-like protein
MTRTRSHAALGSVLKRRRWGAVEAEVVLAAWRESGVSLSAFARRHGLDAWRLMRWRRRLAQVTSIQFHRVKVVAAPRAETAADGSGLELLLRDGHRVAVRRGFDAALLEDLVRAVESWSC